MKELLKIKSIITLNIMALFSYLVFIGKIEGEVFMPVMMLVLGFYFSKTKEVK
jgi:hypothetical protein